MKKIVFFILIFFNVNLFASLYLNINFSSCPADINGWSNPIPARDYPNYYTVLKFTTEAHADGCSKDKCGISASSTDVYVSGSGSTLYCFYDSGAVNDIGDERIYNTIAKQYSIQCQKGQIPKFDKSTEALTCEDPPSCTPDPAPKYPFISKKHFLHLSQCDAYLKTLSSTSYQQSMCWYDTCSSLSDPDATLNVLPWGGKGKCPQGTMYDPNAQNSVDGACIPTPSCDTGMTYDLSTNSCIPFSTCEQIEEKYFAFAKNDCISKGTSLDKFTCTNSSTSNAKIVYSCKLKSINNDNNSINNDNSSTNNNDNSTNDNNSINNDNSSTNNNDNSTNDNNSINNDNSSTNNYNNNQGNGSSGNGSSGNGSSGNGSSGNGSSGINISGNDLSPCDTGMYYNFSTKSCVPFTSCDDIQDVNKANAIKDCISQGTSLMKFTCIDSSTSNAKIVYSCKSKSVNIVSQNNDSNVTNKNNNPNSNSKDYSDFLNKINNGVSSNNDKTDVTNDKLSDINSNLNDISSKLSDISDSLNFSSSPNVYNNDNSEHNHLSYTDNRGNGADGSNGSGSNGSGSDGSGSNGSGSDGSGSDGSGSNGSGSDGSGISATSIDSTDIGKVKTFFTNVTSQYSTFKTNMSSQMDIITSKYQDTRTLLEHGFGSLELSQGSPDGCFEITFHGKDIKLSPCTYLSKFSPIIYFILTTSFMFSIFMFNFKYTLKGFE